MSAPDVDVVVVGSGPSAANAATPLVEAGLRVRMLDVGNRDSLYESLIPTASFSEIRRADPQQHRYFLGDDFEGISFGGVGADTGAQLTPPRQFIKRDSVELAPIRSEQFAPIQSLALGGLGAAWGAGCPPFLDEDLKGFPISYAELVPHYEAVAQRIGVSGSRDDLLPFMGELEAMQPAVESDDNARTIVERYERKRRSLNDAGLFLGQPRLAMLSRDHGERSATRYRDMDYWTDQAKSVYRPRWTVADLSAQPNFDYRGGLLVESFSEQDDGSVEVRARGHNGSRGSTHRARAVVVGAGTLGTARIVLRSLGRFDHRVPLVCNGHTYAPMINLNMLGRPADDRRHSLAQLCFVYAPADDVSGRTVGHVYSYRSLLSFKLLRESPLPYGPSARMIRLLLSSFTITLMEHADEPTDSKYCLLPGRSRDDGALEVEYSLSDEERRRIDRNERAIVLRFRKLGCLCLRRVPQGHAASLHYGGPFPMTVAERELTTEPNGRLRGTRSVYLADGSVFPQLPSKGLTFTMMANADRIGTGLSRTLGS